MSDLHFDVTTTTCVLGDSKTRAGEVQVRLVGSGERQDGGGVCSVWDWVYRSFPTATQFAGTLRAPETRDLREACEVAAEVLAHVEELMVEIDRSGTLGRFRSHAEEELRTIR